MTKLRFSILLGLVVVVFASAQPSRAQYELIEFAYPFHAQKLAGTVVDSTGAPVSGVEVEECDAQFTPIQVKGPNGEPVSRVEHGSCDQDSKHVLASTTTDTNGYFAFPPVKSGTIHYLHFQSKGFDPMQITVKTRWFARRNLRIKLVIAT
jgi:uncharacterized GH25 family protein